MGGVKKAVTKAVKTVAKVVQKVATNVTKAASNVIKNPLPVIETIAIASIAGPQVAALVGEAGGSAATAAAAFSFASVLIFLVVTGSVRMTAQTGAPVASVRH